MPIGVSNERIKQQVANEQVERHDPGSELFRLGDFDEILV
jgi:hypothetical protein